MSTAADSPLPPVRRVLTGHSAAGQSRVLVDESITPMFLNQASLAAMHTVCAAEQTPAVVDAEMHDAQYTDGSTAYSSFCPTGGSVFRIIDYPPGSKSPMHRTDTIDYGTVLQGSLAMQLDDGTQITLHAGDTFVQRATNHAWINESDDKWARVSFVILPAKAPAVDGTPLKDTMQSRFQLMQKNKEQ